MSIRSWIKRRWPQPDDILVVDVKASSLRLQAFLRDHSVELGNVRRRGDQVAFRAFVAAGLRDKLSKYAESVEVIVNASDRSRRIHQPVLASAGNRFLQGGLPSGVGHVTAEDNGDYWSLDEVDAALVNLQAAYPALTSLIELPELTAGDQRRCWALRLGRPSAPSKDVLVVVGGLHGAEWGSCESAVNFATDLLRSTQPGAPVLHYQQTTFTAAQVDAILDKMDIVVFPLVNPDGRLYSRQVPGTLWRKNRNPAQSGGKALSIGVDLNRNFGFLHNHAQAFHSSLFGSGVSNPDESSYCGPSAFSEPESRNVRWLLDSLPDARWLVDLHSPWRTVLHPWSDDDAQNDDSGMNFTNSTYDGVRGLRNDRPPGSSSGYGEYIHAADQAELARLSGVVASAMTSAGAQPSAHTHWPGFAYGAFFGTCIDYAFSRHQADPSKSLIYPVQIEWGDTSTIDPDWLTMRGTYMPEVVAGLVSFCVAA